MLAILFSSILYQVCSIILLAPIGLVFFRNLKLGFGLRTFISILIPSLIIGITSRFIPLYTRELILIISILSALRLFTLKPSQNLFLQNLALYKEKALINLVAIIFFAFLLLELNPLFYSFEAHDTHIFGPAIELFNADYFGNLRNPIYYPLELSSYHTLPGLFAATATFLNPDIALVELIQSKYVLLIIFCSSIFSSIFFISRSRFFYLICLMLTLYFFRATFYYSLSISSYLYAITLLFIGRASLSNSIQKYDSQTLYFCLFASLMAMKAPIFYAALPALFFITIMNPRLIKSRSVLMINALVFFNLLLFAIIPPSPTIDAATTYSIINPFDINDLRTISGMWFIEYGLLDIFSEIYPSSFDITYLNASSKDLIELIYKLIFVMFFYYSLLYFAINYLEIISKPIKRILLIFLHTTIFGWLLVRNNGNMDLQGHLYFLIPFLTIIFFPIFVDQSFNKTNLGKFLFSLLLILTIIDIAKNGVNFSGSSLNYREINSISFQEIDFSKKYSEDDLYKPDLNQPFWKNEILSQIYGKRINYKCTEMITVDQYESYLLEYYLPAIE